MGTMRRRKVPWSSRLASLTGTDVHLSSAYPAALLIIEDGHGQAWALAYGMGFHLLDRGFIDPGFGMRFATRTATPESIQSLTRSELDHRARTDRSSIPAGTTLGSFGMGGFGEVVTRISGAAEVSGLTLGSGRVRVHAADSLSLPLGRTPDTLVEDLNAITRTLLLDPKPELLALEQFVRVKDKRTIADLESKLEASLVTRSQDKLAMGWPHEHMSDNGTPSSYKLIGTGVRGGIVGDDLPTLEELVTFIIDKNPDYPLSAAKTLRIRLYRDSDGEEPMSGEIPLINWLFYEIEKDSVRYCFFNSYWYAMDTDYAGQMDGQIKSLFARTPSVSLPEWDTSKWPNERAYNEMVAPIIGGVMLDGRFLRTTQHPRGFEACDVVTSTGDLIHIKHVKRSSLASHLIAQAVVATDALRYDKEARTKLRKVVVQAGGSVDWIPDRPTSVVLAMARARPITGDDLFSFTKVTLTRLDMSLAGSGVQLSVAPIRRL